MCIKIALIGNGPLPRNKIRSAGSFWACIGERYIGDVSHVVTMTGSEDGLFAATSDRKLWWWQLPGPQSEPAEVLWKPIGEVPPGVISLAEQGGKLFAATQDKVLWWRDTVPGLHDQSSNRVQSETQTLGSRDPARVNFIDKGGRPVLV